MKIDIITCHDVYNYGASLQAYALQHRLIIAGHDAVTIDYLPEYLCRTYNFWYVSPNSRFYKYTNKSFLFKFLLCVYQIPKTFSTFGRIRPFKRFKKDMLSCTKRYCSEIELINDPPKADLFITGSDQVWNPNLPNGNDSMFFLQFGSKDARRISYAASIGVTSLNQISKKNFSKWLQNFDGISVREQSAVDIINGLGYEATNVVDPVFLLSAEEWKTIEKKVDAPNRYILVYDLYHDDERLMHKAKQLAKNNNAKIVAINDASKTHYADINISNAGPREFLYLFSHALCILSSSFHATAFSIIFKKEFFVYYSKSNASRISDLLYMLDLNDRLNLEFGTEPVAIDWNKVYFLLNDKIIKSLNFLYDYLD